MTLKARRLVFGIVALVLLCGGCFAATFGTAVPVRGTVSDIALDESRGPSLYFQFHGRPR